LEEFILKSFLLEKIEMDKGFLMLAIFCLLIDRRIFPQTGTVSLFSADMAQSSWEEVK